MFQTKKFLIISTAILLALFSSCDKEQGNNLGQANPIEELQSTANQNVELGVKLELGIDPISLQANEEDLRAIKANVSSTLSGGKITIKQTDELKALLVLKCDDPSVPYMYRVVTCVSKGTSYGFKDEAIKFAWNGDKSFEELKDQSWHAMLFLSKEIADDKTSYDIGSTASAYKAYELGQDIELDDVDVPFFSEWQEVRFTASNQPNKPNYTLNLGTHQLKPQGILTRVHFDNKLNLDLKVRGYKVESNAYNFVGTYDLSESSLKANSGKPLFVANTSSNVEQNIKGANVFVKSFMLKEELSIEKNQAGGSDCLFWIMPVASTPVQPYSQIYVNAYAPDHTETNANGNVADDTVNALKNKSNGGTMDHGAVANVALNLHAPSMKNLPAYASYKNPNIATMNGKSVFATLKIDRPKTFVEWIAETPLVPENTPEGVPTPNRGALGFTTDMAYPRKVTDLYHKENGSWRVSDDFKDLALELRDQSRFHYSYDVAQNLTQASGYIFPSDRQWFAYCSQPVEGYQNRTSVEEGYINQEQNDTYYKARLTGTQNTPQKYTSYISGSTEATLTDGMSKTYTIYAMRFANVDGKRYRVLTRYFISEGHKDENHPFLKWNAQPWNDVHNENFDLVPISTLPRKKVEQVELGKPLKRIGAYHSVTVRYIGANYAFNEDLVNDDFWATEAFWAKNNEDDIVRYYPMYGYSFNMCFRQVGLRGIFWTADKAFTNDNHTRNYVDVFSVSDNGFKAKSSSHLIHRYGETKGRFEDFLSVIPVTDKDWGE